MPNRFLDKLERLLARGRSPLCVGLDPNPDNLPERYPDLLAWNRAIIEATTDLAACYKPNIAFYEALGRTGYDLLEQTLALIPPEIPVILDAKRGDIGSTAEAYARACFQVWDVDAVTLSPYLGGDSIRPFTAHLDRYVFVLCHTSNPSAGEMQQASQGGLPLYQRIAAQAPNWGQGNVGLVVGATYPQALAAVRAQAPESWLLVPGVGAQGGDVGQALMLGTRADGRGVLVNVSRGIALADDPARAAENYAKAMQIPTQASVQTRDPMLLRVAAKLHERNCIRFGEFTLASGVTSPVYIDLRLLTGDPAALAQVAQIYARQLHNLGADRIAGVPYAALPIATAVSLETGLPMIYPRKEVKTHGRSQAIEGEYRPGDRIVVIEDLVTTAGSLLGSIERLRAAGLVVSDAVVLIDREQGGTENLAAAGVQLHAAYSFSELLDALHATGRIGQAQYEIVRSYRA